MDQPAETIDYTAEVLGAQETVAWFAREHNLTVERVECHRRGSGNRFDGTGWNKPCLPTVTLAPCGRGAGRAVEILRWVEALRVEKIRVQRRDFDTCLNAYVDHLGITWQIWGSLSRGDAKVHLPGITPPWRRDKSGRLTDEGSVTPAELRTALTNLGVDLSRVGP